MLQRSKFVNTKSQQKASKPLQFPLLSKDLPSFQAKRELIERVPSQEPVELSQSEAAVTEPPQEPLVETPVPKKIHASVNLNEMQRLEELRRQDDDWMAFFMGKASAQVQQSPEFHFENEPEQAHDDRIITTPSPDKEDNQMEEPPFQTSLPAILQENLVEPEAAEAGGDGGLNSIFAEMIDEDKIFGLKAD